MSFSRLSSISSLLIPAILLGTPTAFAANIVVNGGFEDTTTFPGQPSDIRLPVGWTLSDPELPAGGTAVQCAAGVAHTGSCAAYFANVGLLGSLSQVLSTTPGVNYVLTFYLQNQDQPNQFIVNWGGAEVLHLTNIPDQPYTLFTLDLSASSASTKLTFSGLNTPTATFLDDVSVEARNVVPEPSTWFLGLAGFAAFAAYKFRQR